MASKGPIVLIILIILQACSQEPDFPPTADSPIVITDPATAVTDRSATLNGRILIPETYALNDHGFIVSQLVSDTLRHDTISLGPDLHGEQIQYQFKNMEIVDRELQIRAFAIINNTAYIGNLSELFFEGALHTISTVTESSGIKGDTVSIFGDRFSDHPQGIRVIFNEMQADIIDISTNEIRVRVPGLTGDPLASVGVEIAKTMVVADSAFTYLPPVIHSIEPLVAAPGMVVTITGENFGYSGNEVEVLHNSTTIISESRSEIRFRILQPGFRTNSLLRINHDGLTGLSEENFLVYSPWRKIARYPYSGGGLNSFIIGSDGYAGGGNNRRFYRYSPQSNSWFRIADFPHSSFTGHTFTVQNQGHMISGGSISAGSLYQFHPDNGQGYWAERARYPEVYHVLNKTGFEIGNKAYVLGGSIAEDDPTQPNFYSFDVFQNAWTEEQNFPIPYLRRGVGFTLSGEGYIGTGNYNGSPQSFFYKYDPIASTWEQIANFPHETEFAVAFTIDDTAYVGLGTSNDPGIYVYNPNLDNWQVVATYPGNNLIVTAFTIDGKAYIGGGSARDFFEFDPEYLGSPPKER